MKYVVSLSLLVGLVSAFYTEDTTFTAVSTGDVLEISEAYEDSSKTYSKVLVYLHGGGGSRDEGIEFLNAGYFGESITGLKLLCPSSPHAGGSWYDTYKEGENDPCDYGYFDACVYNFDEMNISGQDIADLIENEINVNGISTSDIYLAGFSQGGRMVFNVAHGQLTYAIGGYFGYATSPQYPVWQTVSESEYTYADSSQSWFLFGGEDDSIYSSELSIDEAEESFAALSSPPTIEYSVTAQGVGHTVDCRFTQIMMRYIEDGTVTSIEEYEVCSFDEGNKPGDDEYDKEKPFFCFSGNMGVMVREKGLVSMETLQVGDYVKIGKGEESYSQVYAFGHRDTQLYTEFVQLHTSVSTPPLEMTGEHLVFVEGKTNPVRADSIKIGDILHTQDNSNGIVQKINVVHRNGIYNPLTTSGTIQVNGIAASTYISFQKGNMEYVELQGGIQIPFLSHHDFAHLFMTPYRLYCTNIAICNSNINNDDANMSGMPVYVSMGIEFVQWRKQQHIAVQIFVWASILILVLVSIPAMTYAVLTITSYLLSEKSIYKLQRIISHTKSFVGINVLPSNKMNKYE